MSYTDEGGAPLELAERIRLQRKREEEKAKVKEDLGVEAGKKDIEEYESYKVPTHEDPIVMIEKGFKSTIGGMRKRSYETLEQARQLKAQGKDVAAGVYVSIYTAKRVGTGALEGLTLPLRPIAMIETGKTAVGLVTSAEKRTEFVEAVKRDPVGFVGEVAGGVLGATVSPFKIPIRKQKIAKPVEVTSPSSLIGRGTWPKSGRVGFGKSRGSVVILQSPQLRKIPIVPSYVDPIALTIGTSVALRAPAKAEPDKPVERVEFRRKQLQEWRDPITRMKPLRRVEAKIKDPVKETEEIIMKPIVTPVLIPKPVIIPDTIPLPVIHPPMFRVKTIPRQVARARTAVDVIPDTILKEEQKQRDIAVYVPRISYAQLEAPEKSLRLRLKKRRRDLMDPFDLDIWGEKRKYPVKDPKIVLKDFGI